MNYKVTKIGLINFWYFDDEQFEFSDGKLLLRGENGSGKSVTMQSFIPLILDGNKTPSRLDPFGSKEKRIEDYLLGPSDGVQKEEATGYLYMEVYEEEKSKYVTIGMGLRARKGQATDFWGFALKDGKRIGEDFQLYKDYGHKILLTKKELKARIGIANEYTESTKEYKKIVNDLLFGFKEMDSYDEFINVLLQLRSSKLSKDYTPTKLMTILSSVLQPLTEDDIRPLSQAIEETNKTKERIETLEEQLKSLNNLFITYQNYNEVILYHKANAASEQAKKVNEAKHKIAEKTGKIEPLKSEIVQIENKIANLNKEQDYNDARIESIDNKDLKKNTQDLTTLREDIRKTEKSRDTISETLDKTQEKEKEKTAKLKEYQKEQEQKKRELRSLCKDISALSDEVKLFDIRSALEKIEQGKAPNFDYLEERVTKYKIKLDQVKQKLEEQKQLELQLNQIEEALLQKKKQYEENAKKLQMEEKKCKENLDLFKDEINLLEKNNKIIKFDHDIKTKIFGFLTAYNHENYLKARDEYQNFGRSYEKNLLEEKNKVSNKVTTVREEIDHLKQELEILKNNQELELEEESEGIAQLTSFNIPFMPFYKAIEFKENITEQEKNRIEELLATMNILNAKIVASKNLNRVTGINAVFLKAGTKKENNLLKYFQPSSNTEIDSIEITRILESISIDSNDPLFVNPDCYQLDFIVGFAGKSYQSKYIGVLKRIEEQKRKIKLKEEEIVLQESFLLNYQTLLGNLKRNLEIVQFEIQQFPSNKELEINVDHIKELETALKSNVFDQEEFVNKEMEIKKQLEHKIQEIHQCKENILIPLNLTSYKETIKLIDDMKKLLFTLKETCKDMERTKEQIVSVQELLDELKDQITYKKEEVTAQNHTLQKYLSREKALQEILNDPKNQKLIEELEQLTERKNKIPKEKEELVEKKGYDKNELKNLEDTILEDQKSEKQLEVEWELKKMIFEEEYRLHHLYQEEICAPEKVVNDLKNRKNSDPKTALENYLNSFNEYRIKLLEYRLNTKRIFEYDDQIQEMYVKKGVDIETVKEIIKDATRHDMTAIYNSKVINVYQLVECLKQAIEENQTYISKQERHLFEDILLKTVGTKIRDRIESSKAWVSKMNEIMEINQVDSNLSFQLEWRSKVAFTEEELDTKELVRLFKIDAGQLDAEDSEKLINHFRSQIKKELEANEKMHESYTSIISRVLDYRNWFEFKLFYKRKSGEKRELTNKVFFILSGGERAKSMYVPLFASVYAKLLTAKPNALRLIALDEAFAGVDNSNVREMFAILSQLKLDYILTSQSLWGDYDSIQAMAICELIKDEVHKAVAIRHYHWNGKAIELLENRQGMMREVYE